MKKFSLFLLSGTAVLLTACGERECNPGLDECSLLAPPYTEERTVGATKRQPVMVTEPVAVEPAPRPVVQTPPPAPAPTPVVDDTPVMTTAEPQFKQISK